MNKYMIFISAYKYNKTVYASEYPTKSYFNSLWKFIEIFSLSKFFTAFSFSLLRSKIYLLI